MVKDPSPPLPLFDTIEYIQAQPVPSAFQHTFRSAEFQAARAFLLSYNGTPTTFNAYRREVERLLHWSWEVAERPIRELKRTDIEAYLQFCQQPPVTWIGLQKVPRFMDREGIRFPNPAWRAFVATVSKSAFKKGKRPGVDQYALSGKALREILTISGSFYNFLIQEGHTEINPVQHVRQKSRYYVRIQGKPRVRRLSPLQWHYVMKTAETLASLEPAKHHRTLFIMTALYAMYLRISELAASPRWIPKMGDFYRDADGLWWFNVLGKGNKLRQIAVSDNMLTALKVWRQSLNLSPLPAPSDAMPLIPREKGRGPVTSITWLRKIVQQCFDRSIERLDRDGLFAEAEALQEATVHWLRHTGISEDVKHRPREHVRDDAGHSSSAITDKYIDIELRERHASARKKPVREDD